MATLALGVAGAAIGSGIGGTILGVSAATIGMGLGQLAGSYIDMRLLGGGSQTQKVGPQSLDLEGSSASEGTVISRGYGDARYPTVIVWHGTPQKEVTTEKVGGKGGGGGQKVETTTWFCDVVYAVRESTPGASVRLGRVWVDGNIIDLSSVSYRLHDGTIGQAPDPVLENYYGIGRAPAYPGIVTLVFERLPLADFGNRLPQLSVELLELGDSSLDGSGAPWNQMQGVALGPATGEKVYATEVYTVDTGNGVQVPVNAHVARSTADVKIALDDLQSEMPALTDVLLPVAWFANDLRAGSCVLRPLHESVARAGMKPHDWVVASQARRPDNVVPLKLGTEKVLYGGTPSDRSVVQLIKELYRRGLTVNFLPFILSLQQPGNGLPDPYGGAEQATTPWRGRITPIAGSSYSAQIASFFGAAVSSNFGNFNGHTVPYSGPDEWTLRRQALHYAKLILGAAAELGVPVASVVRTFIVFSEMKALTRASDNNGATFPAVAQLRSLINDIKALLPGVRVIYAPDWSEMALVSFQNGTERWHLAPLWDECIAFSNYAPLTNQREGALKAEDDLAADIYDVSHLEDRITAGFQFDYFYATQADEVNDVRTAITEGRYRAAKDFRWLWENNLYEKTAGVQDPVPVKYGMTVPIVFAEYGCPSLDRGTNEPNVFFDGVSSESALPKYSTGAYDPLIQQRYFSAWLAWRNKQPVGMLAPRDMWAWNADARPVKWWRRMPGVWADNTIVLPSHNLNGKMALPSVASIVRKECLRAGLVESDIDLTLLYGPDAFVPGLQISSEYSAREIISQLRRVAAFDVGHMGGKLRFVMRRHLARTAVSVPWSDVLLSDSGAEMLEERREPSSSIASQAVLVFADRDKDYSNTEARAYRYGGPSRTQDRIDSMATSLVLEAEQAKRAVDVMLHEQDTARTRLSRLMLPPSYLTKVGPGSAIRMYGVDGEDLGLYLVVKNDADVAIDIEAERIEPRTYIGFGATIAGFGFRASVLPGGSTQSLFPGPGTLDLLALPAVTVEDPSIGSPRVAYRANGAPAVVLTRSIQGAPSVVQTVAQQDLFGEVMQTFVGPRAPFSWDDVTELYVQMYDDKTLTSYEKDFVLTESENALAIQHDDRHWEVIQFAEAQPLGGSTYRLRGLVHGALGTDWLTRRGTAVTAGNRVVKLSRALMTTPIELPYTVTSALQSYRYGLPNRDFSDDSAFKDLGPVSFEPIGLMPYPPALQPLTRLPGGDISIKWARRSRWDANYWDVDVADQELVAFDLQIETLDGSTVLRSINGLTGNDWVYSAADQIADFGGLINEVRVTMWGVSSVIGRGKGVTEILKRRL